MSSNLAPQIESLTNAGSPAKAETAPARRVLLAEDDAVARLVTTRFLEKAGYEVVSVENGREAIEALERSFFPVVLTDWEMPEVDGLGVVAAVRGRTWPGYIFTVLLTGRDSRASVIAGLEAGADDYLTKPVDRGELLARMKTAWRIADLERRLRASEQEATRLSLTDELTGVHNRRYLAENLQAEVERARRFGRPVALVMCDIDHFKRVNDTWGHPGGDDVLRAFSGALVSTVRKDIDWVARYGGEEFVVVLPETNLAGALVLAEKLRAAAAALEVRHGEATIRLTSSFGVAAARVAWPDAATGAALIAKADLCLYQSKEGGRDRVTGEMLEVLGPDGSSDGNANLLNLSR